MESKATVYYKAGKSNYTFPFAYISKQFVKVRYDRDIGDSVYLEYNKDYNVTGQVLSLRSTTGFSDKDTICIYRETPTGSLVDFNDGSVLLSSDMDRLTLQLLHIVEEQRDALFLNGMISDEKGWQGRNKRIKNIKDPVEAQDVTTKEYVDKQNRERDAEYRRIESEAVSAKNSAKQSETTAEDAARRSKISADESKEAAERAKQSANKSEAASNASAKNAKESKDSAMEARESATISTTKAEESKNASVTAATDAVNSFNAEMDRRFSDMEDRLSRVFAKIETVDALSYTQLKRNKEYHIGDVVYFDKIHPNLRMECVKSGTTPPILRQDFLNELLDGTRYKARAGDVIHDGDVYWMLDDIRDLHQVGDIVFSYVSRGFRANKGYLLANGRDYAHGDQILRIMNFLNIKYNLLTKNEAFWNTNKKDRFFFNEDTGYLYGPQLQNRAVWTSLYEDEQIHFVEEELPNIKGEFTAGFNDGYWADAAFDLSKHKRYGIKGEAVSNNVRYVTFDASRSNPIYKENGHVKPNAFLLQPLIKL